MKDMGKKQMQGKGDERGGSIQRVKDSDKHAVMHQPQSGSRNQSTGKLGGAKNH